VDLVYCGCVESKHEVLEGEIGMELSLISTRIALDNIGDVNDGIEFVFCGSCLVYVLCFCI
jgi:hypothetical protein